MPDYETGHFDATIQQKVMRRATVAGVWKRQNAAEHRAFLGRGTDTTTPEAARDHAARLDDEAALLLDPATYATPVMIGTGGEVAIGTAEPSPHVDTLLRSPDMVAVDASRHRLGLARQAGGIALALDAAETAQAANSLEKMLAHQIAAAHIAAMELQAEALALLGEFRNRGRRDTILTAEAARLLNASARMMDTAQHGVLALHRLRTSGRQTLVVQHVHISEGGQAVVADQMKSRTGDKRTTRGG